MTAQNGLHNLPASPAAGDLRCAGPRLRPVPTSARSNPRCSPSSAPTGRSPRTRADDLYAPWRPSSAPTDPRPRSPCSARCTASVRGRGRALKDLERAYPVAMGLLDRPTADGVARRPSARGRAGSSASAGCPLAEPRTGFARAVGQRGVLGHRADGARGRYARNAIIQGSAAELFKAWAATVRHAVRPLRGQIVLCLHDELLSTCPSSQHPQPPQPPSRPRSRAPPAPGPAPTRSASSPTRPSSAAGAKQSPERSSRAANGTRVASGIGGAHGIQKRSDAGTAADAPRRERLRAPRATPRRERRSRPATARREGQLWSSPCSSSSVTSLRNASNSRADLVGRGQVGQVGGEQVALLAPLEEGVVLLLEGPHDRRDLVDSSICRLISRG